MSHSERSSKMGNYGEQVCPWKDVDFDGINAQPVCDPMVTARIDRISTFHSQSVEADHPVVRFGYDEARLFL